MDDTAREGLLTALRAEEGVHDAVLRHDPGTGDWLACAVVDAADADVVGGRQRRLVGTELAVAELHRNETEFLHDRIFVRDVYLRHGPGLPDGATVVDVGANIGMFSLYASYLAADVRVVAVEPDPRTVEVLRANLRAHQVSATVVPAALGERAGRARFVRYPDFSLLSGLHADPAADRSTIRTVVANRIGTSRGSVLDGRFRTEQHDVPVRTLSDVLAEHLPGPVDLLKVNAERSELAVLRGVDPADWARVRRVIVEVDEARDLRPVVDLLGAAGLTVRVEQDDALRGTSLHLVHGVGGPSGPGPHRAPRRRPRRPAGARIAARLADRLPGDRRPDRLVTVDALPTADDQAGWEVLAAAATRVGGRERTAWRPGDPTEAAVAAAWAAALGSPPTGPDQDFLTAGGDSLQAVDLCADLHRRVGRDLDIVDVLEHPTVAGIAALVAAAAAATPDGGSSVPPDRRADQGDTGVGTTADAACADLFNGAVAAAGISAAWELGLLDSLERDGRIDLPAYCRTRDLHLPTVDGIVSSLTNVRILTVDPPGTVRPGPRFAEAVRAKGLFHWLVAGCGELFATLPGKAPNAARTPGFYRRDAQAVAVASREIGRQFIDPVFWSVVDRLDFTRPADLGCGSAGRLIAMAGRNPEIRAVGIDVSAAALDVARKAAEEAGCADLLSLVRADVTDLSARPEYAEVDLLTCLLMGHDFWPRDRCIATLRSLRDRFPRARNLILVDTCRAAAPHQADRPVFGIGFEVAHAAMGVFLPTVEEWLDVLADGGWECREHIPIDLPANTALFRLSPLGGSGRSR